MEIIPWKSGDQPIPDGTTGLFQMKAADYHSDPCEKPSLSASIAKKIVGQSPYHAWLAHPRFGGGHLHSDSMDRGTLLHSMLLGHDPEEFALLEVDDFRTKAARAARDSARAEGKTPVKMADFRSAQVIAEEVHADLLKQGFALQGLSEIVALWTEEVDGVQVQCRGMLDHLMADIGLIVDFKSCETAHPQAVQRAIYNYGYDIQFGAYTSAYRKLFPDMAGREEFLWAFVEILSGESPRSSVLQLYRPDGLMRELGSQRWHRGVKRWAECISRNHWPLYGDGPLQVSPQGWIVKEELGEVQE